MNNIICLGSLNYNMNFYINNYPIYNNESTIIKKYKSIGNNINIPIILRKYNTNVYYFSILGEDYEGMEILKFLNNNKINTEYINILKNTTTNKKYIIKNVKNDDKIILRERINNKYTLNKKINFIPNIIYTQMYDVNLIKQIKTCTLVTRLNEISNDSINTCMLSDYIIIPLKYAQILSNIKLDIINKKTITDLYLRTKRLFSGKIIIYIEKVGCLFENNKVISIIPKIGDKNKVSKNSYDIFTATFIYCISNNYNISDSVKISILSKFLSDNNKQNLNISEVIRLYEKNS